MALDRRPAQRRRHHGARVPLGLRGPQGDRGPALPQPHRARARARGSRRGRRPSRSFPSRRRARRGAPSVLWAALALLAALSLYLIPRNPANVLLRPPGEMRETADLLKAISLNRAVSIERAVRIYYDSSGRYPRSLEDLVVAGILDEDALRRSVRPASTATSCAPRTGSSGSTAATRPARSTSTSRSREASPPSRSCGRRLRAPRSRPSGRASWWSNRQEYESIRLN